MCFTHSVNYAFVDVMVHLYTARASVVSQSFSDPMASM